MKSKNIPADIKSKTIKEAQNEIKEIIEKLENTETNLEDSIEKYNRMMLLNYHINDQFRQKAKDIKDTKKIAPNKNQKKLSINSKKTHENLFK